MSVSELPPPPVSWAGREIAGVTFVSETPAGDLLGVDDEGNSHVLARSNAAELDLEAESLTLLHQLPNLGVVLPRFVARENDRILGEWLLLTVPDHGLDIHLARPTHVREFVLLLRAMLSIHSALASRDLDALPHLGDLALLDDQPIIRRIRCGWRPEEEATPVRELLAQVASQAHESLLAALPIAVMHASLPCGLTQLVEWDEGSLRALFERALAIEPPETLHSPDTRFFGEGRVTAGICDRGLHRQRDEDAVEIATGVGFAVLVVCDGVSASLRAALASSTASQVARTWIEASAPSRQPEALVAQAIRKAHQTLCGQPGEPMGTTIIAALVQGSKATIGWIGDSRAYFLVHPRSRQKAHGSRQISADHSWLREVVAAGMMTHEEALESPHAHALTRCLGPLPGGDPALASEPELVHFEAFEPGYLMLCSDGLWNYFHDEVDMTNALMTLDPEARADEVAERLLRVAMVRGGHDNISVAVRVMGR